MPSCQSRLGGQSLGAPRGGALSRVGSQPGFCSRVGTRDGRGFPRSGRSFTTSVFPPGWQPSSGCGGPTDRLPASCLAGTILGCAGWS